MIEKMGKGTIKKGDRAREKEDLFRSAMKGEDDVVQARRNFERGSLRGRKEKKATPLIAEDPFYEGRGQG